MPILYNCARTMNLSKNIEYVLDEDLYSFDGYLAFSCVVGCWRRSVMGAGDAKWLENRSTMECTTMVAGSTLNPTDKPPNSNSHNK